MKKSANWATSMESGPMALRGLAGAIGGGLFGRYVTPRLFDYESSPAATNMSTLLDAAMFGGAAAGGPTMGKWLKENPANLAKLVGGVAGSEIMPVGMQMVSKGVGAANDLGESARNLKMPPSISEQALSAARSPEGKGALAGAGTAGIAAMLSGLLRARTQGERENSTGRGGMVTKDFLKLVLPMMLAGGLAGNVLKDRPRPTGQA